MKRDSIFLLVFAILSLISAILVGDNFKEYVWFCNHIPFIFLILILLKRKDIIQGILNPAMLIQLTYLVNMFTFVIGKDFLPFVRDYLSYLSPLRFVLVILLHSSTLIALIYVHDNKPKPHIFKYSMLYVFIIYLIGYFVNISANCATHCFNTGFNLASIYFALILITNEIQRVIYYGSVKHTE